MVIQLDGTLRPTISESLGEALFTSLLSERRDYCWVWAPAFTIHAVTHWDSQKGNPTHLAENLAWQQKHLIRFRAVSIERIREKLPGVEIKQMPETHPDLAFTCRKEIVDWMGRFLAFDDRLRAET